MALLSWSIETNYIKTHNTDKSQTYLKINIEYNKNVRNNNNEVKLVKITDVNNNFLFSKLYVVCLNLDDIQGNSWTNQLLYKASMV